MQHRQDSSGQNSGDHNSGDREPGGQGVSTRSRGLGRFEWFKAALVGATAIGAVAIFSGAPDFRADAAAPSAKMPAPAGEAADPAPGLQKAVLSGGCFWGVQGVFQHVKGVQKVLAGYAGGKKGDADYETVSTGRTGHAESVEITYDPAQISYGQILQIFFSVALDPTQLNFQGPDWGPQYRSEVFFNDDAQKKIAEAYIAQLDAAHLFHSKIVTRVDANSGFFPAEDYHQDYLVHHPDSPYIAINDIPKVEDLKHLLPEYWREKPALVFPGKV